MKRNYNDIAEELKNKYNINKVYSYSQVKLYEEDPYEYYLKYVAKIKPDKETSSAYGIIGGMVHDILERFYKNELGRENCKVLFQSEFSRLMNDPKTGVFSQDPSQNRAISTNLITDISDYFDRVVKLEGKIFCEEEMSCYFENHLSRSVFMGYIDFLNIKNGKAYIIDYKTSTLYKEEDIPKYSHQLILYAESVRKKYGFKYEDIFVGWNFLKYAKLIDKINLSEEIVERKNLYKYNLDYYVVQDCTMYIPFNDLIESEFDDYICNIINEIESKVNEYNINHDDSIFMYEVTQSKMFRLNNFCNYTAKYHRPLREYLERNTNV